MQSWSCSKGKSHLSVSQVYKCEYAVGVEDVGVKDRISIFLKFSYFVLCVLVKCITLLLCHAALIFCQFCSTVEYWKFCLVLKIIKIKVISTVHVMHNVGLHDVP